MYVLAGASECPEIPTTSEVRSGPWSEYTSKWGCPVRIYPYWFWPNAPYASWYGVAAKANAQRASAWRVWSQENPSSYWMPPFVADYGLKTVGVKPGPAPLPVAQPTTIPCWCWASPGFKDAHAAAYKEVQKLCNYDSVCMNSEATKNLINYRAMANGGALCKREFDPCCGAGKEPCPGGKPPPEGKAAEYGKYVVPVALAAVGYLWWKKRQNRRKRTG